MQNKDDDLILRSSGLFVPTPKGKPGTNIAYLRSGANIDVDGDPTQIKDKFVEQYPDSANDWISFTHMVFGTPVWWNQTLLLSIGSTWKDLEFIKNQQEQMERAAAASKAGIAVATKN
jgi:hypothetical protein